MNLAPKSTQRGFTLIELLVVIAIIGILSAVVLASLNTARNKGTDAAIKANLATVQTQAELYYDTNSQYSGSNVTGAAGSCATASTMFADVTISNAIKAATSAITGATEATNYRCTASSGGAGAWAISTRLTTSGQFWCADSTGVGKQTAALHAASTYVCP